MYCPICPHCSARKTVKFGLPRWKCNHCKKTFRLKRKDRRDRAAINGYVLDRSTYRRLAVRWNVGLGTAHRRVQRALHGRYSLLERTKQRLGECDGVLFLDGKHIRIKGKLHICFVAWDRGLKKPVHFLIKEGGERELWYWRLLVDLERLGYRPRAFVSDGILTLKELLAERYPDLPHQRCAVHVFLSVRSKVYVGRAPNDCARDFIELIRMILWSQTMKEAKRRFQKLWNTPHLSGKERRALQFLWPTLPQCFICRDERWRQLKLPRSSNAIENVMGQIEARLKTRRGEKGLISLDRLVNELLLHVSPQTINH
jgi:transposase-like protein